MTTKMIVTLLPTNALTPDQSMQLLELLTVSFKDEPAMRALEPADAVLRYVITKWVSAKRLYMNAPHSYCHLVDGRVVAHGMVTPPGDITPSLWQMFWSGFIFAPLYIGWPAFSRLRQLMGTPLSSPVETTAYKLQALVVDPEYRGKGLGTAFLKALLHEKFPSGAKVVLFTQVDRNVTFYERNGFHVCSVATTKIENFEFSNWIMQAPTA
ncbi:hypothetical protein ACHHYP_16715 [Achlya hypogyna]|uniref:N-acetyltransferase domain-containing protein n=1 Tax=Achlya hypogyna TaxID=1202772 RepID=A0A1V9Y5Y5_ACHHY|nr:hypothetical protein ACHHYP_16715 [Achlya hypogyna]